MSKARLVITAVVTEGRSQGEVARAYGVSQGWVSRLVARYRAEGEAVIARVRPKDGSIRSVDLPPFLAELLDQYLAETGHRSCTCTNAESLWCSGGRYVFLGPGGGHFRRSNCSTRIVRPAADGWYPERKGPQPKAAAYVMADLSAGWPGAVQSPWPRAIPGEPYEPPAGRGIPRLAGKEGSGRCAACGHTIRLRLDGLTGSHKIDGTPCAGTGAGPAE